MLTPAELENLYQIINGKPETTLENIIENFQRAFSLDIQNWFKPCYCLMNMITDNLLT